VALLAAIFGGWVLFASLVIGFFMGTTLVLPFVLVPRGRRERFTMTPAVWYVGILLEWLMLVRARVEGTIDLRPGEGALLISNHRSWLDPVLLMRHSRSNGLSKSIIFWIPFIGQGAYMAGAVFFDRNDRHDRDRARREVMELVRTGHRIQVFPEGTRTRTGELGERVYLTLPMDCFKAGQPVVCCAVYGTERVLPPGVFQAWPFQEVRLVFGRTLRPQDHPDARAFANACWDEVKALVARLRAEEERGGSLP
jgi:1-acyl-sn-glycerol-3-phosphate acyltransferase